MDLWESSLNDLLQSAIAAFPDTTARQHATEPVEILQLRISPYAGMKTLLVRANVRNEDRNYRSIVLFKGVNFHPEGEKGRLKINVDGRDYFFDRLSLDINDVAVRCSCDDFKFRFRHYNRLDKSLFGADAPVYKSKGVGPPANPRRLEGMCKHLIRLMQVIDGVLT